MQAARPFESGQTQMRPPESVPLTNQQASEEGEIPHTNDERIKFHDKRMNRSQFQ